MVTLLKMNREVLQVTPPKPAPEIAGWMIAMTVHELRLRASQWSHVDPNAGDVFLSLEAQLYRMEFPSPGQHDMGNGFVLLVE